MSLWIITSQAEIYWFIELWEFSIEIWASLVAQMVKNPPTMWETWLQSLGWEDPLEKGTAILSNILVWRIPTDRGA